jgi:hypothetical protein
VPCFFLNGEILGCIINFRSSFKCDCFPVFLVPLHCTVLYYKVFIYVFRAKLPYFLSYSKKESRNCKNLWVTFVFLLFISALSGLPTAGKPNINYNPSDLEAKST